MRTPTASSAPPAERAGAARAALTAVLAAVLSLIALGPPLGIAIVVLLCAVALGVGLPRLLDLPHGTGAAWFLGVGAPVVTLVVWLGGTERIVLLLAGSVVTAFVHQMVRRDGRPRLTESVAGDVLGLVVMCFGTGWFVAAGEPGGETWVVIGALAVVLGAACAALPVGSTWTAELAGVVAAVAGALVGGLSDVGWWQGGLVGLVVGVVTAALHRTSARSPSTSRLRPAIAAATIPVLTVGAVVAVGRLALG